MPRWLMRFEVDPEMIIADGHSPLEIKHPDGIYEAYLENGSNPEGAKHTIIANLVFESIDMDAAEIDGWQHMNDLLDVLALITGGSMKIKRRVCLYEWSAGLKERHGRVYHKLPEPDLQDPLLDKTILPSIVQYLGREKYEVVRRGLHWFASGVAASSADDQFQYFWHAVETLAQYHKPSTSVADVCAVCKTELVCPKCKGPSKHKPYDSQAIKALFLKFMAEAPDAYDKVSHVRNKLLHGESLKDYKNESGQDIADLMDVCAEVAWRALMVTLAPEGQNGVQVMKPTTYRHHELSTKAFMSFPTPEGREPTFADIPTPTLQIRIGRRGADGKPDEVSGWM